MILGINGNDDKKKRRRNKKCRQEVNVQMSMGQPTGDWGNHGIIALLFFVTRFFYGACRVVLFRQNNDFCILY